VFLLFLIFLPTVALFSLGKKQTEPPEPRDTAWTLCISSFDVSTLSSARSALGEIVMRDLVTNIEKIRYRVRVAEEYAYYENIAKCQDLAVAAKTLESKRNERDQALYRGDAAWRYRKNIKTMDLDIKKLEASYRTVAAAQVIVAKEPVFTLAPDNLAGRFPVPPKEGEEYRFCKSQKADALITGSMREYHNRIFVTLKLYILYTDSFVFSDSIIFSPEDSGPAMDEFAAGITAAITGNPPAELYISTVPKNALILLNHGYAGRGEISSREYPPGKITLEVFADNYESATAELELKSNEHTDVSVDMRPLVVSPVEITVPGAEEVSIYQGSLYVGEAPLSLNLPRGHLEYIFAQTPDGQEAEVVFLTPSPNALPLGIRTPSAPGFLSGIFPRRNSLKGNTLSLSPGVPYDPKEQRVDKIRRGYYWAWGGTWLSAITAWMINGYATGVIDSYNSYPTTEMYDKATQYQLLNYAGIGLVGAAVLVEIIQMARYIHVAGEDAPPYVQ
jgi:TolB-like protein